MNLPASIAARVEQEIAKLVSQGGYHIDDEGIRYKGLPLMGTLGAVWLLRPDGSLWTVDSDFGLPFRPLEDRFHTTALVAGTERYPWLKELLPSRPADAIDCPSCQGRGEIILRTGGRPFCWVCDALGWLVPKEPA